MAIAYQDRMFISMNGLEVIDVESITLKQSDGTKVVPTMTRNRRSKGTVKGNREITFSVVVAVQQKLGTPKIEDLDFTQSIACTLEHGADRYTLTDIDHVDVDQSASGVGSEGKKTWNFVAMDCIDQVGNSVLFPTNLLNAAN